MKLYELTAAPNPRRVRVFLAEKGITVDSEQIDIFRGDNLTPEFRAINPRGVIPTLELDDGTIIDETSAICRYFEAAQPEPSLYGKSAREQAVIESWVRKSEQDAIAQATYIIRNGNPLFENRSVAGHTESPQVPALVERGRKGLTSYYERLDAQLSQNAYVAGQDFSVADITAMCAVDFAEFVGVAVPTELTHLVEWRARVSARPSSKA